MSDCGHATDGLALLFRSSKLVRPAESRPLLGRKWKPQGSAATGDLAHVTSLFRTPALSLL